MLTHGGHFYAADNYTVYATAQALMKTGSLEIEPGLGAVTGRGGKAYGLYGIGLSLLQAPFIAAGSVLDMVLPPNTFTALAGPNVSIYYPENFSVFAATLVTPLFGALAAAEFWVIAELLGYPLSVAASLTIILVASTQFWPAARDSFPQMVVAGCLLLMVCHAMTWSDARFRAAPLALGCAAGLLMLVRPFDAFLTLPPLSIYLLWQEWHRIWRERHFLNSNFGRFLIPLIISVALVGLHNAMRFGNPMILLPAGTISFNTPFLTGLYGLLLSIRRSVFLFSPPVLATLPGLIMLCRRRRAEALLFAALIAVYPIGYATYVFWDGGLCWGNRFLVPALPFAVLPLGELLLRRGVARAGVLLLAIAGLPVQLAGTMVDFQRATLPAFFSDPGYSQIAGQWRDLLAGRNLDWLPMRLYLTHGLGAAAAYAVVPLAMVIWAAASLRTTLWDTGGAAADGARSPCGLAASQVQE